jgi:hypothetical protein
MAGARLRRQSRPIIRSTHRHEAQAQNMALPLPVIPPQLDAFHLAPHRIKRCTFRRLINVEMGSQRVYDVECLFPDRKVPIPLGDLEAATPICNACVAPHIFRPDED